jgi:hypothetical protein
MRAHLYQVITDTNGAVKANTVVRVLQADSDPAASVLVTDPIYASKTGVTTVGSTFTAADGIIDVWLDSPGFVMLGLTAPGMVEYFIDNVLATSVPTVHTDDASALVIPGSTTATGRDGEALVWDAAANGGLGGPAWKPVAGGGGAGGLKGATRFDVSSWYTAFPGQLLVNGWGPQSTDYPVGPGPVILPSNYDAEGQTGAGSSGFGVQDAGWYSIYIGLALGWQGDNGPDSMELNWSQWYSTMRSGQTVMMRAGDVAQMSGGNVKGCELAWCTPPIYLPGADVDTDHQGFQFQFQWADSGYVPTDQTGYNSPLCTVEVIQH